MSDKAAPNSPKNRDALVHQIRQCSACDDLPLGPRPILQFHHSAKILIAGQAPGRITHAKGIPFDDPSGQRLRHWLGVDRTTFYDPQKMAIVPMGFCYPGSAKGGDLAPKPRCAQLWRAQIMDHLKAVKLTLILGRYAMDWHQPETRGQSVTKAVQNWRAHWPKQLILPHPSPRNNRWLKQNPWFENDIIPMIRARINSLIG